MPAEIQKRKSRLNLIASILICIVVFGILIPEIIASGYNKVITENQKDQLRSIDLRKKLHFFEKTVREMDQIQFSLLDGYDRALVKEYYDKSNSADKTLFVSEVKCTDSLRYVLNNIIENFSEMKAYGKSIILMSSSKDTLQVFSQRAENACAVYCMAIFMSLEKLHATEEKITMLQARVNLSLAEKAVYLRIIRFSAIVVAISFIIIIAYYYRRSLRQRMYELLEARRIAEESLQHKEQFITHITHEIRTPLNALLGFADLLSATPLTPRQRRQVEALRRSGESLQQVVNDVLDYSKMEAGMMQKAEVIFAVREQAEHVQTMFLPMAAEKQINLDLNIDKSVPRKVKGDPGHLRQILINLVSNAIKFTHQGEIVIHIRSTNSSMQKCWLAFEVSDTGIGIPANQHQEIFRRFYQAVPRHDGQYIGTGLGLSIVRKLTELMGGNVAVSSRVGEGTSFTVTLPFTIVEEEQSATTTDVPLHKHLLIAEDHPLGRQLIHATLEDKAWKYDLVTQGCDVISKLRLNTYDMVLLDFNLPEMNAEEITLQIRNELKLKLPIVGISAAGDVEIKRGMNAGMNEFLSKPFTPAQLINCINRYIPTEKLHESGHLTNLAYLHKLSNGNHEFVKKMINQFISENKQETQEIRHALDNNSLPEILRVIHRMRTTITFVGLDVAAAPFMDQIEAASPEDVHTPAFHELVNKLIDTCRKAAEELEKNY
jgi:signal transduction histidine kinase/CheY-like chemotaxis protein/HPt (histidine-containing phosphotransfer) domain-containing protein